MDRVRQSITLTRSNDEWLSAQLGCEAYSSRSEVVNDLIGKAREQEQERLAWLQSKLIKAEQSGFTPADSHEILAQSKAALRENGEL